jgi:shikimate 5-dehydrogenase
LGYKRVYVANRDKEKVAALNSIMPCTAVEWSAREQVPVQLLINATSVGMAPLVNLIPVNTNFVQSVRAVMDVVVSPMESRLITCARASGKAVAPGYQMSLEQAAAQFTLYTGHAAPRAIMEDGIRSLLSV